MLVSPPAVPSWDIDVVVSEELSWNGPLLSTMMKFFWQVPAATGDLYCGPQSIRSETPWDQP